MRVKKGFLSKALLVLFYGPMSCLLAGVLASYLLKPLLTGRRTFWDIFRAYAIPSADTVSSGHWPSLAIGLGLLLLLLISAAAPKPVVRLVPIRILLLVLIVLVTIFVKISIVVSPLANGAMDVAPLFFFADLDLVFVYLLTFLPLFRRLGGKSV